MRAHNSNTRHSPAGLWTECTLGCTTDCTCIVPKLYCFVYQIGIILRALDCGAELLTVKATTTMITLEGDVSSPLIYTYSELEVLRPTRGDQGRPWPFTPPPLHGWMLMPGTWNNVFAREKKQNIPKIKSLLNYLQGSCTTSLLLCERTLTRTWHRWNPHDCGPYRCLGAGCPSHASKYPYSGCVRRRSECRSAWGFPRLPPPLPLSFWPWRPSPSPCCLPRWCHKCPALESAHCCARSDCGNWKDESMGGRPQRYQQIPTDVLWQLVGSVGKTNAFAASERRENIIR